jgi:hypothetical protein
MANGGLRMTDLILAFVQVRNRAAVEAPARFFC